MQDIQKTYDQAKEQDIYKLWEASGYFNPDNLEGKPFTIMMPPPNATGTLHIGHAFESTLQDILIRYHRMKGEKTLWLPGTDHAAIATNTKVEKILMKETGQNRHDIGREAFVKKVEEFVRNSRGTIQNQIRTIGASPDWTREAFTLDEPRSLAVRTAFKKMYDAGLIYRGVRLVNWDPYLKTTVSDDEIEWKEEYVPLYHLKYGPFVITTARPETKFGDKYVVVHPKDPRYKQYQHGQTLQLDWINGPVVATIIKDSCIDMKFGTGAMTITPWHDATDFEIANRHNLDKEQIISERGLLLPKAGEFAGQHIKKARALIIQKLNDLGLVEKVEENYLHRIAVNSRGGGIIEPQIKEQWFVDVNKKFKIENSKLKKIKSGHVVTLKLLMKYAVESGEIKILPERFKKIYYHWIDNLRDWNISRQLWYGHQIPVWYCGSSQIKRMGFYPDIFRQVISGKKTKTYRLNDHHFKIGDLVSFDSDKQKFGWGTITNIEHMPIKELPLNDPAHGNVYKKTADLIAAFKRLYPAGQKITPTTEAIIYTYQFKPFSDELSKNGCGQIIADLQQPHKCPACGNTNLEQDPDTLDTWFSSALWTFSALGWPNETIDLKKFHPTDVMAPGYEILFFWVARMILMSTFLLGEIPFKTVYLHGMVRDIQGRKFSKSLDNGIDPIEIINQYGADSLRMGLIVGVGPGNDSKYDEQKIRGYRNFANKVWNASRFVLQNTFDYTPSSSPPNIGGASGGTKLTKIDAQILKKFTSLAVKTTSKIEKFDFAHAAEDLYHYFWHEFADKIIEQSKANLADPEKRESAQRMLHEILQSLLKMLHPFMPFVTESIWQIKHRELLLIEKWPVKSKGLKK
jgi:valyl-tRNA synthetase